VLGAFVGDPDSPPERRVCPECWVVRWL
jgi:hypothetical protein